MYLVKITTLTVNYEGGFKLQITAALRQAHRSGYAMLHFY